MVIPTEENESGCPKELRERTQQKGAKERERKGRGSS